MRDKEEERFLSVRLLFLSFSFDRKSSRASLPAPLDDALLELGFSSKKLVRISTTNSEETTLIELRSAARRKCSMDSMFFSTSFDSRLFSLFCRTASRTIFLVDSTFSFSRRIFSNSADWNSACFDSISFRLSSASLFNLMRLSCRHFSSST